MAIDLHTHSTASDGTLTPPELVRAGVAAGLSALALTDHDTVAGLDAFIEAAAGTPLRAIAGVEVAATWYGGSLHLVGLFIDHREPGLLSLLARIRGDREIRNRAMVERLNGLGVPVTYEEVQEQAGDELVARPHFAAALVKRGICATRPEAFSRFLATNGPAYVRRFLPMPVEAVAAIHRAGGVAVLAHPLGGSRPVRRGRLRGLVRRMAACGIDAVETLYSDHTADQARTAAEVAAAYGLAQSGGSDFHGETLPGLALGVGRGELCVPEAFLPELEARAARHRLAQPSPEVVGPLPATRRSAGGGKPA